ncbi:MAG TPA: nuclear transport factor 2 family protein [Solirubrobacterales bacterium]|nr:nuclear transport factor 2 family protein [Solirubrobacterales bacterium]
MEGSAPAQPEAVARGYFDAVARRDIGAMASFWEPGAPDVIHGVVEMTAPADLHAWFGDLFTAFPDFSFAVLDVIADGEKVAVRWHATGTFDGPGKFEGLLANGGRVDVEGCDVLTVRDGLIRRNDAYMNGAEMARQLGALPPAGSPPERALTGALNLKTRLTAALRRR